LSFEICKSFKVFNSIKELLFICPFILTKKYGMPEQSQNPGMAEAGGNLRRSSDPAAPLKQGHQEELAPHSLVYPYVF